MFAAKSRGIFAVGLVQQSEACGDSQRTTCRLMSDVYVPTVGRASLLPCAAAANRSPEASNLTSSTAVHVPSTISGQAQLICCCQVGSFLVVMLLSSVVAVSGIHCDHKYVAPA